MAGRLEDAGIRTIDQLAQSTPEALARMLVGLPGCSSARIADMDWVGQARRLGGTGEAASRVAEDAEAGSSTEPPDDPTAPLHVVRVGASQRAARARSDEPAAVSLQLRAGARTPQQALAYSAAITARRLDQEAEVVVTRMSGVVQLRDGISHAAAGPSLDAGLYRLTATIEAYAVARAEGDQPVWSETVDGELLEVVDDSSRGAAGGRIPAKLCHQLLADGAITEAEHARLIAAGAARA